MIEKIAYKEFEFGYPVFNYLYSSLFNFAISNEIDIWSSSTLRIDASHIIELLKVCEFCANEILDKYYKTPSEKQLAKHPNRYVEIVILGKEYVIDYRLDPVGREVVGIHYLIEWLRKFS